MPVWWIAVSERDYVPDVGGHRLGETPVPGSFAKTEHLADGGNRIVPIFPELYPYLMECFEHAQEGEKNIITRYRHLGRTCERSL